MENRLAAQALTATKLMMRRFISHITANNIKKHLSDKHSPNYYGNTILPLMTMMQSMPAFWAA
jgi:hypothetical protein